MVGLVAGIATGLFLGDEARIFATAADAFVKLLQMAVLPYVTVSIVASVGALSVDDLRRLGTRGALVLAAIWAVALALAFLMPMTFPPAQSASFFSTTLLERPAEINLVDLYIPANPFFAMANSIVPAVVLFSMVTGVALIGLPRKRVLLDVLEAASGTLSRAMSFVVSLTPYGLFAIAATTAGTLRIEQAVRLQIYLMAYAVLALVLALWVLPGLVSALTGIRTREIFASTREALMTATIAGDQFIVLPLLIAACRELVARHYPRLPQMAGMPDVVVPVSFNFPHSGKLLSMSFILFAGWFSDAPIDPTEYPRLALTALLTLFGSINTAVPFLLDAFRVPADTFQLFVASSVINSRFGSLVAAMHTVTVALLVSCAAAGALRMRLPALARYAVVTVVLTAAAVGGTRLAASLLIDPFSGADVLDAMTLDRRGDAVALSVPEALAQPPLEGTRLETIASSRTLRVGYLADALPYAFVNGHGDLVGFDVALMHRLALELGVRVEFAPVTRHDLDGPGAAALLRRGSVDIIAGGLAVTTTRAGRMQLSSSYLEETFAFVVPDADRRRFASWDAVDAAGAMTIAAPDQPYYVDKLRARLPRAQLRTVQSIDALFQLNARDADAFALSAERGSAWTLRYPQYAVVVPIPQPVRVPLAFALPRGETELMTFVNTWIDLKRRDGALDELYQYWILGRDRTRPRPRWSIIRDVLKWGDSTEHSVPASRHPAS
jgi:Na+/H+-dicarboxylate symporter/ABC-type amino acid transport substrate-binding protein